jgi:hypothetical protein
MPNYDYKCNQHGVFEKFCQSGIDYQPCPQCGLDSEKTWTKFPGIDPLINLWSGRYIHGEWVHSKSQLQDCLARNGIMATGPGDNVDAEIARNKRDKQAKWDADMAEKQRGYIESGELTRDMTVMEQKIKYLQGNGLDALDNTPDKI